VELAHEQGILTAASLMVAAAATAHAIARARRLPRLRIGLHLVLVDGRPALPPERLPDLVDATGHLRTDLARLGLEMCARPSVQAQVRAEIEAQFRAYQATGLALDHVNAHKHFHLHPAVAHEIIAIGRRYGMRGLRVPREPAAVLTRVESGTKRSPGYVTPWTKLLAHRVRRAGLRSPDSVLASPGPARCRLQGSVVFFAISPPVRLKSICIRLHETVSQVVRPVIATPTSSQP
jgi:chitin disaccharide deacetylase